MNLIVANNSYFLKQFLISNKRKCLDAYYALRCSRPVSIGSTYLKNIHNAQLLGGYCKNVIIVVDSFEKFDFKQVAKFLSTRVNTATRFFVVFPKLNNSLKLLHNPVQLKFNTYFNTVLNSITQFAYKNNIFSLDYVFYSNPISTMDISKDFVLTLGNYNTSSLFITDISQLAKLTYSKVVKKFKGDYGNNKVKVNIDSIATMMVKANTINTNKVNQDAFMVNFPEDTVLDRIRFDYVKTNIILNQII